MGLCSRPRIPFGTALIGTLPIGIGLIGRS